MEIYLAKTQGFCAGVATAVDIVERALAKYGPPLYVYHEIVHNTFVVAGFKKRGVIFVENISEVPEGEHLIFSAHGVGPAVLAEAQQKKLNYIDATCPLVTKVHKEALSFSSRNIETILIGHKGHQELIGTAGYVKPGLLHIVEDENDVAKLNIELGRPVGYLTQTTLSVTETEGLINQIKKRYPKLLGPKRADVCYATQNRQDAVKELAKICDVIIICGSPNSSNSNRLRETGERQRIDSYIIDKAEQLDMKLLSSKKKVGISSGASVPRDIVEQLVERIKENYPDSIVHEFENPEKSIVFPLPSI